MLTHLFRGHLKICLLDYLIVQVVHTFRNVMCSRSKLMCSDIMSVNPSRFYNKEKSSVGVLPLFGVCRMMGRERPTSKLCV